MASTSSIFGGGGVLSSDPTMLRAAKAEPAHFEPSTFAELSSASVLPVVHPSVRAVDGKYPFGNTGEAMSSATEEEGDNITEGGGAIEEDGDRGTWTSPDVLTDVSTDSDHGKDGKSSPLAYDTG